MLLSESNQTPAVGAKFLESCLVAVGNRTAGNSRAFTRTGAAFTGTAFTRGHDFVSAWLLIDC